MKHEKSAGAVVFRRENGVPLFLLLHYPSSQHRADREYWDLPKGHVEKGESERQTALREVREETGISDLEFVEGYREEIRYTFQFQGEVISKTVIFFLAETKTSEVTISHEHHGFMWLPKEKALSQLTYDNARNLVNKASEML